MRFISLLEVAATTEASEKIIKIEDLIEKLIDLSITAGKHILAAVLVYIIGSFLVKLINRLLATMLARRKVDISVQSFLKSMVNILLLVLLLISVIGALGVNTTSFAALLASAGIAVGMALSGNLSNFAGGIVILLFKPFKVGDWIEAQGTQGAVKEIQIFHTILITADNKTVYIPNGNLSSALVTNYSQQKSRRITWEIGVEYGEDIERVRTKVYDLFRSDPRVIQNEPGQMPFVGLDNFGESSVNLIVRVWVKPTDYWDVFYEGQQKIYDLFNREGINIPFPQRVVHMQSLNRHRNNKS